MRYNTHMLNSKAKGNKMQNVTHTDGGYMLDIAVNKMFTTCGDGYWSNIAKEVFVEKIAMFISTENIGDEGDAEYCDGDLQAYFTEETWNDSYGLIYTDSEFLACVHTALTEAGISIEAALDVSYSEQGMQGDEYVSMDAYALGDYVRARMQNTVAA
jgi:hypothetical protein